MTYGRYNLLIALVPQCHIRFFTRQKDFVEIVDTLDLRPAPVALERDQRSVIDPQSSVFVQRQFHVVTENRPDDIAMRDEKKSAVRQLLVVSNKSDIVADGRALLNCHFAGQIRAPGTRFGLGN